MDLNAQRRRVVAPAAPWVSSGGRPLRLALVTSSYAYIEDGVALTLNRLVRYLESQAVEVLVFTPLSPDRILPHAGTIEAVPSAPMPVRGEYRLTFGLPRAQRERLRAFAPDIVHIATPDFLGHAALKFARELGVPTVASFHTRYDAYLKHYGLGFLHAETGRRLRRFYDAFDEVYAPSASMVEALEADGARNIRLWSRGVDIDRFHPEKRDEIWRAANSIAPETPVVVFAGRLVREKGLAIFAGAIAALAREGLPHQALVIGDGPDGAGLRAALPHGIFCRVPARRGPAESLGLRRYLSVPEQDRDLRQRDPGSDGERTADDLRRRHWQPLARARWGNRLSRFWGDIRSLCRPVASTDG